MSPHHTTAVLVAALVAVTGGGFLAVATVLPLVLARRARRTGTSPIEPDPLFEALLQARAVHLGEVRLDDDHAVAEARMLHARTAPVSPSALDALVHPRDLAELEEAFAAVHAEAAASPVDTEDLPDLEGVLAELCQRRAMVRSAVVGTAGKLRLVLDDGTMLELTGAHDTQDVVVALALGRTRLLAAKPDDDRWELRLDSTTGLVHLTADTLHLV